MRLVDPQGLHLPSAAVQGQHQLRLERLPQRMFSRQRLELRHDPRGPPARQLGVDAQLVGNQAQLPQPLRLGTRPVLVSELRVRAAPPQTQPLPQHPRRPSRVAPRQAGPSRRHRLLEACDIERLVAHLEHVAGRPRHHPRPRLRTLDHTAQARHITPQRRRRSRGRRTREHDLAQPIDRHHPIPVDQQDRRQAALPRPAKTQLNTAIDDTEATQNPILEHPHSNVSQRNVSTATALLQPCGNASPRNPHIAGMAAVTISHGHGHHLPQAARAHRCPPSRHKRTPAPNARTASACTSEPVGTPVADTERCGWCAKWGKAHTHTCGHSPPLL
jgi:hypothetical protein